MSFLLKIVDESNDAYDPISIFIGSCEYEIVHYFLKMGIGLSHVDNDLKPFYAHFFGLSGLRRALSHPYDNAETIA